MSGSDQDHNSNYAFVGLGMMLSFFIIIGSYLNDKKVDSNHVDKVDARVTHHYRRIGRLLLHLQPGGRLLDLQPHLA